MTNDELILARSAPLTGNLSHQRLTRVLLAIVILGFSAGLGLLSIASLTPPAIKVNATATDFSAARAQEYLKRLPPISVARVVDHIDHVVKLVGIEHVGIGSDSDLMGYDDMPKDQYEKLKAAYKASYAFREKIDTDGFDHPRKTYDLTAALLRRGYGEANIQLVLGGNFRRLLGATWLEPKRTPTPEAKNPEEKKS